MGRPGGVQKIEVQWETRMNNNNTNHFPSEQYQRVKDIVEAGIGIVTALAAVAIPIAIHKSSNRSNTITFVDSLNDTINNVNYRILEKLGREKQQFTYDTITNDVELERDVFALLNDNEGFSYAILNKIISRNISLDLRRDALLTTWDRYEQYILEYRKRRNLPDAWIRLESLVKQIKR